MKRIINLSLTILALFTLSSCSKYYISAINSTNIPQDEKTGEFKIENDSLKITYSFAGENAPVKINIQNKLATPLYIDWSQSSLIFKNQSISYVPDKIAFTGEASSNTWNDPQLTFTDGNFKGKINNPKDIGFVPPHASLETTTLFLTSPVAKILPDNLLTNKGSLSIGNEQVKVKSGKFTRENSPIVFRSYLTFFTKTDERIKSFFFDREFYVSESVIAGAKPNTYYEYQGNKQNIYYTKKTTNYGNAMKGVAVLGLFAGAALLPSGEETK